LRTLRKADRERVRVALRGLKIQIKKKGGKLLKTCAGDLHHENAWNKLKTQRGEPF